MNDEDIRISVIVPTCGRLSLKATLLSILPQMRKGDELIVVHDGPGDYWPAIPLNEIGGLLTFSRTPTKTNNSGGAQRDHGMALATGTHLMFCDDDDIFTPNALAAARDRIARYPESFLIFRMQYGLTGANLWHDPVYRVCNVGTPMFVLPNVRVLPRWSQFDESVHVHDFMWGQAVQELTGMPPIFIDEVISIIRPRNDQLPPGA